MTNSRSIGPPLTKAQKQSAIQLGSISDHRDTFEELLQQGSESAPVFLHALSFREYGTNDNWSAYIARRLAAEGLGRIKAIEGVDPLLKLLDDPDHVFRGKAVWALGEIGEPRAIPFLIPLLGEQSTMGTIMYAAISYGPVRWSFELDGELRAAFKVRLGEVVAQALDKLGRHAIVQSFQRAIQGDMSALKTEIESRDELIAALMKAVETAPSDAVVNAVRGLRELSAVESLPVLRKKLGTFSFAMNRVRSECSKAIEALEAMSHLPSPSMASPTSESLPRAVDDEDIDTSELPRAQTGSQ